MLRSVAIRLNYRRHGRRRSGSSRHDGFQLVEAVEIVDDFREWDEMDYIQPRLIVTSPELTLLMPGVVARENNVVPQGMIKGQA